jgi:hypothetical protein
MRNRKQRSLFDLVFGDDMFSNSFFSIDRMSFSTPLISFEGNDFPAVDDPNFNHTEEVVENENHTIKKETWTSIDGTQSFQRISTQSKRTHKALKEPSKEELKQLMDKAVEDQQFEKAIEYRDKLKKLDEK